MLHLIVIFAPLVVTQIDWLRKLDNIIFKSMIDDVTRRKKVKKKAATHRLIL
jgi:hypothetical protein